MGKGKAALRLCVLAGLVLAAMTLGASPASAGPGYELASGTASIGTDAEAPRGLAIDQANQLLYVTELATSFDQSGHGQIEQFTAAGAPTANSPFVTGGTDFFTGVAVNPVNQNVYAHQTELVTPFGSAGAHMINTFSSAGSAISSFSTAKTSSAQLASDSSGRIYFPNDTSNLVQVFDSAGTLKDSIGCTGCPGGGFVEPASVAIDSAGNLYVVDLASGGRVVKFVFSAGSYSYSSVLQSGRGAAAVGIDPVSNDVFVGSLEEGEYHVVAYDSAGTQFDDFGGGVLASPKFGALGGGQIAVSQTTRKLYVADSGANKVWIFDRVSSIPGPTASTSAATSKGQLGATLNGMVDPNGHGLIDCHFEYTNDADFQVNGFANAVSVPCASKPSGTVSTNTYAPLTGLSPATKYDYRIVTATNGGAASGTAQEFETLPALPPTVTTGSASSITQTSAMLAGTVNPRGGPVSDCRFEYVEEADFQVDGFVSASSVECQFTPEGTSAEPVAAKANGLTASTTYRFRVVATNNSGTTEATEQAFTTAAETCETNPALCPPPPVEEEPATTPPPVVVTPPPPTTTPPSKPLKCRKGFKKKRVRGKLKCVKVKKRKRR